MPKKLTASLFALLFLLFASVIMGDNTSEALLLGHFPMTMVPRMVIVNSILLFLISLFLLDFVDKTDRGRFFTILLAVQLFILLGMRALTALKFMYIFPLLYSYAYVSKTILLLTFWTMASDMCDSRQAKTVFPVIAAGGILGGVLVSYSLLIVLKFISAANLLLMWAGLIALCFPLFFYIRTQAGLSLKARTFLKTKQNRLRRTVENFSMLRDENLLRQMAIFFFLVFFILINQDFTFLQQLKYTFADQGRFQELELSRRIAVFLGVFKGSATAVTFIIQLTVAGYISKRLGTARAMFVMPTLFFLCFGLLLAQTLTGFGRAWITGYPFFGNVVFLIITAGVAGRIAVFDSVHGPNFNIFFSSLGKDIRGRGKLGIEGLIKPLAISSAGIFVMLSATYLPPAVSRGVILLACALLLVQAFRLKREYSRSIIRWLKGDKERFMQSLQSLESSGQKLQVIPVLKDMLDDGDAGIRRFAVNYLGGIGTPEALDVLYEYFPQADRGTQADIVKYLGSLNDPELLDFFAVLLTSDDPRLAANTATAVGQMRQKPVVGLLLPLLRHPNHLVQASAVVALWPLLPEQRAELRKVLEKMSETADAGQLATVFGAAGEIGDPALAPLLLRFRAVPEFCRPREWQKQQVLIRAMGKIANPRVYTDLLFLEDRVSHRNHQLLSRSLSRQLKGNLNAALLVVTEGSPALKRLVLQALLLAPERDLPQVQESLSRAIWPEIGQAYYRLGCLYRLEQLGDPEDVFLLVQAFREKEYLVQLHIVIKMLQLLDPAHQLDTLSGKITAAERHLRASALELVENTVETRLARVFIPLFEPLGREELAKMGQSHWKHQWPEPVTLLRELMAVPDRWLAGVAAYSAATLCRKHKIPQPRDLFPEGVASEEEFYAWTERNIRKTFKEREDCG